MSWRVVAVSEFLMKRDVLRVERNKIWRSG